MKRRFGSRWTGFGRRAAWRTSWIGQAFTIGVMLGIAALLFQITLDELRESRSTAYTQGTASAGQIAQGSGGAGGKAAAGDLGARPPGAPPSGESGGKPAAGANSGGKKAAAPAAKPTHALDDRILRIYLTKEKRIEQVPLETYVRGAVAGEMPLDFDLEALKAQAIAARTYIVRRLYMQDTSGVPVRGADVTDTIEHQVYIPLTELGEGWPEDKRKRNMAVLDEVIDETRGLVVTYDGEPIEATFFSTSNGYTENSEDYWQQKIPYLRSVASPWDTELSPRYKETVTMTLEEFYRKLGFPSDKSGKPSIKVTDWTEGKRIGEIRIEGRTFSGREAREKLGLASAEFKWRVKGDTIAFTTYGYGHGIGMSQWGANGMAREGRSALDILAYYYSGTKVEQASKLAIPA